MELLYNLSDRVLATVKGFEPWPATIDNVVCAANKRNVSYNVRLDGSYKSLPINVRCLKPLKPCDEWQWDSLCADERWHEARKRTEVVEGVYITVGEDGNLPPKLGNFEAVDSDYENVSDIDKANLKLSRVAHNAKVRYSELEEKFKLHAMLNKRQWRKKVDKEEVVTVDDEPRRQPPSKPASSSQHITVIRFRCPGCSKKYKTRMALKKHMEHNAECDAAKKPTKPAPKVEAQPPEFQCTKCLALFRNQELLLRHVTLTHKSQSQSQPKKKNGIRDHIRHQMTTNRHKMGSYYPKSKPTTNGRIGPAPPDVRRHVSSPEDSEDDLSDDSGKRGGSRLNKEVHNDMERRRRLQLKHSFAELGDMLDLEFRLSSKASILSAAKEEIENLVEEQTQLEQILNDLRDMNIRLVSRHYQLTVMGRP